MNDNAMPWLADFAQGAGTITAWAAAGLAALIVLVIILETGRARKTGGAGALTRIVFTLIAAAGILALIAQNGLRDLAASRDALENRISTVTARAAVPGSPLGCLTVDAGDVVEAECEKAVFANASSVAAAVTYVGARVAVLEDAKRLGVDIDRARMATLADLRRSIERDPYGIASHVLATRNGCTAQRCEIFALLRDTNVLQVNLQNKVFDAYVKRHADGWKEPKAAPVAKPAEPAPQAQAAPEPTPRAEAPAAPTRPPVATRFDFPSAASIPPVSIMNPEPPRAAVPADIASTPPEPAPGGMPVPPRRPATQAGTPPAQQ